MNVIDNHGFDAGSLLSCAGVRHCFAKPSGGEIVVLNDVDLTLQEGESWDCSADPARANPPCCVLSPA